MHGYCTELTYGGWFVAKAGTVATSLLACLDNAHTASKQSCAQKLVGILFDHSNMVGVLSFLSAWQLVRFQAPHSIFGDHNFLLNREHDSAGDCNADVREGISIVIQQAFVAYD